MLDAWGHIWEYRMEGERYPENPYYLDETMPSHFSDICDIAEKYQIKLIIGLLTGYMSGRVFIPSALFEKNLFTDSTALYFEKKLIQGIVTRFKDKSAIFAWDLGNECNSMCPLTSRMAAATWTAFVSNTIRAYDSTRPVISWMHELHADTSTKVWTLKDQGEFTDILTTHPYPYWTEHAQWEEIGSMRTTMHATCQTKFYSGIGEKIAFTRNVKYKTESVGAQVIVCDQEGTPAISKYSYGKGTVWYVNFPLEEMLLKEKGAFENNYYKVYNKIFDDVIEKHPVHTENPYITLTLHDDGDVTYCVAVSH